jgi:hypothetical protein
LRYAENLKATEEEMIYHCKPETGRGLDDEEFEWGSNEDLKHYQEGRDKIPDCQEGNGLRSTEDLTGCHEDNEGISHCQLGNDRRSLWHLKDCQEGSGRFPVFQVGKETEMELVDSMDCQVGRDEHLRLSESLRDSEESSIQQGLLMKMGSVDLIVCQEGNKDIPYCQVGRDEQVNFD